MAEFERGMTNDDQIMRGTALSRLQRIGRETWLVAIAEVRALVRDRKLSAAKESFDALLGMADYDPVDILRDPELALFAELVGKLPDAVAAGPAPDGGEPELELPLASSRASVRCLGWLQQGLGAHLELVRSDGTIHTIEAETGLSIGARYELGVGSVARLMQRGSLGEVTLAMRDGALVQLALRPGLHFSSNVMPAGRAAGSCVREDAVTAGNSGQYWHLVERRTSTAANVASVRLIDRDGGLIWASGPHVAAAVSDDGSLVAIADPGGVEVQDADGELVCQFARPGVRSLTFSAGGDLLAVGSSAQTVAIVLVSEGRILREMQYKLMAIGGDTAWVADLSWSRNGEFLAFSCLPTVAVGVVSVESLELCYSSDSGNGGDMVPKKVQWGTENAVFLDPATYRLVSINPQTEQPHVILTMDDMVAFSQMGAGAYLIRSASGMMLWREGHGAAWIRREGHDGDYLCQSPGGFLWGTERMRNISDENLSGLSLKRQLARFDLRRYTARARGAAMR